MLKIRLQRIGRKNDPAFRVVVVPSETGPKSGKFVELLGSHNPRQDVTNLNADRIKHWIANGAQVSPTLHNILVSKKIIEGKKINVLPKKQPIKKEGDVTEGTSTGGSEAIEGKAEQAEEAIQESVENTADDQVTEKKDDDPTEVEPADGEAKDSPETEEPKKE